MKTIRMVAICPILVGALSLPAQTGDIKVNVDAGKVAQKILHVDEVLPVKPGPLTLYYPKWIPGEHGPDGPVSNVAGLKFDADGADIPWTRDLLDIWTFHVEVPAGKTRLHVAF